MEISHSQARLFLECPTNITTGTTGTGNITFNSAVDGSGDLTLTAGGDISFQGNVGDPTPLKSLNITSANNIQALKINTSTTANGVNGGDITLSATGRINTSDLNSSASGNNAKGGNISLTATKDINTSDINTAGKVDGGNVTFTGPIVLDSGLLTTISTGTGSGDITFNGAMDGSGDLTLTAGAGNISFLGKVDGVNPLNKPEYR